MKVETMDKLIECLKKDFDGSSDYISGVNDGMYNILRLILSKPPAWLRKDECVMETIHWEDLNRHPLGQYNKKHLRNQSIWNKFFNGRK